MEVQCAIQEVFKLVDGQVAGVLRMLCSIFPVNTDSIPYKNLSLGLSEPSGKGRQQEHHGMVQDAPTFISEDLPWEDMLYTEADPCHLPHLGLPGHSAGGHKPSRPELLPHSAARGTGVFLRSQPVTSPRALQLLIRAMASTPTGPFSCSTLGNLLPLRCPCTRVTSCPSKPRGLVCMRQVPRGLCEACPGAGSHLSSWVFKCHFHKKPFTSSLLPEQATPLREPSLPPEGQVLIHSQPAVAPVAGKGLTQRSHSAHLYGMSPRSGSSKVLKKADDLGAEGWERHELFKAEGRGAVRGRVGRGTELLEQL